MRINQYVAILDTCVLAPMPVADTLMRLADEPAFYTPRWSPDIFKELETTLHKFGYPPDKIAHRLETMQLAFPDAMVHGYEDLIEAMKNQHKDRHVLAAGVKSGANCIVSNNKKHFEEIHLAPYNIDCLTADEFLQHQYHLDEDLFIGVLKQQASDIGWTLPQLLSKHVLSLATLIVIKDQ